jgi:hypothetical protein
MVGVEFKAGADVDVGLSPGTAADDEIRLG